MNIRHCGLRWLASLISLLLLINLVFSDDIRNPDHLVKTVEACMMVGPFFLVVLSSIKTITKELRALAMLGYIMLDIVGMVLVFQLNPNQSAMMIELYFYLVLGVLLSLIVCKESMWHPTREIS